MIRKTICFLVPLLVIVTACGSEQGEILQATQESATRYAEQTRLKALTPSHTPTSTLTITPTPNPWVEGNPGVIRNVMDAACNASCELLAVAADQGIFLVNTDDFSIEGFIHLESASSVAFSPDETLVAVGGRSEVLLFDLARIIPVAELDTPAGNDIVFSPDGSLLAAASGDSVSLWDVNDESRITILKHNLTVIDFEEFPGSINRVLFSPDGTKLFTTNIESRMFADTWTMRGGHSDLAEIRARNAAYEKSLLSKVSVWSLVSFDNLLTFFPGNAAVFSRDEKYLITVPLYSARFEFRRLTDLFLSEVIETSEYAAGWSKLEDAAISADGNRIAFASWAPIGECDLIIGMWDTEPWEKLWKYCYQIPPGSGDFRTDDYQDQLRLFRGILFSKGGDILFYWGRGTLMAIDTETGEQIKRISSP